MPRIFISYRRQESGGTVGRIRDRLIKAFGARHVFVDVDKIHYGDDFQRAIDEAIRASTTVIAIIGRDWASRPANEGVAQGADYVYAEIEAALRLQIPIIPVLVDEATMPPPGALPDSIASITRLNYTEIKITRFEADVTDLIRSIDDRSLFRRVVAAVPAWVLPMVILAAGIVVVAWNATRSRPAPAGEQTAQDDAGGPPLAPPMTRTVKSDILERVVVNPPIARPGELVTISVFTNSSQVQASAVFEHGDGQKRKVSATYDRNRGGIVIEYVVPAGAQPGQVSVELWVQELKGQKEEKQSLKFEVRSRTSAATGSQADSTLTVEMLGMKEIRGGGFSMGSSSRQRDERPVHQVTVDSFLLMDHELTFDELQRLAVRESNVLERPIRDTLPAADRILTDTPVEWGKFPVSVTFKEATRITAALSSQLQRAVRLPTEAEWEYAARGGLAGKEFPWGDLTDRVNGELVNALVERVTQGCAGFDGMPVHPVKTTTPPNPFGLFDVAGNVWEWTDSAYKPYPYSAVAPADLAKYEYRVIRGGGLAQESCQVRVAFRGMGSVASPDSAYGVRIAADNRVRQ